MVHGFKPAATKERIVNEDQSEVAIPSSYFVGQEIKWDAPWIDVSVCVELPFWLMVGDVTVSVEVGGHDFEIAIHENYSELYVGLLWDSKENVVYRGPWKKNEDLSEEIRKFMDTNPNVQFMWRKCKTILKIKSRCNEHVWNAARERAGAPPKSMADRAASNGIRYYFATLCKAHIPVVNKLIQGYRLATYDYFPYEVSPWDVAFWFVERDGKMVGSSLVPYKQWDLKPKTFATPFGELMKKVSSGEKVDPPTLTYKLIEEGDLQNGISIGAAPGEFELLDSLNLMERGDYSGAVRRITTAIEVIVESVVGKAVEVAEGGRSAVKFLKDTETNFKRRVERYQELSGRTLSDIRRKGLFTTRKLRHRIVHRGYRINPGEQGRAQRAVDTGRWTYNWFENNKERTAVREKRIAFRSLGRETLEAVFPSQITPDGVVIWGFTGPSSFYRIPSKS
jgi:adenylate kinase family enzyme